MIRHIMLLHQAKVFLKNNTEKHFCWGKMGAGWELGSAVYCYYADLTQILSLVIALTKEQP